MHWTLINTVLRRESCLLAALLTTDSFILLFSASLKALLIAFRLAPYSVKNKDRHRGLLWKLGAKTRFYLFFLLLHTTHTSPKLTDRAFDDRSYQSEAQNMLVKYFMNNRNYCVFTTTVTLTREPLNQ